MLTLVLITFMFIFYFYFCSGRSSTGFGVVECNPLVLEQIDKSVKYVIMPYMPMVSKPKHWKG